MKRIGATILAAMLALPGAALAQDEEDDEDGDDAPVQVRVPPHRYTYAGAGVLLLGGLGMSYFAQGSTLRARDLSSAQDHARTMETARNSAATANMLYVMAGMTLVYGLALELLPRPLAEKADLTFHF